MPRQRRHVSPTDGKSRRLRLPAGVIGCFIRPDCCFCTISIVVLFLILTSTSSDLVKPPPTHPGHPSLLRSSHFEGILKYLGTPGGIWTALRLSLWNWAVEKADVLPSRRMRADTDRTHTTPHALFSLSFVSFFFSLKVCLNSDCVCCLASLDHVHTAATHSHTSLEPTTDDGGVTPWRTAVRCTSGHAAGVSCERSSNKTAGPAAAWAWSASVYPYLLTCVRTYSSPVIVVFYSFWGKWSLKETLVWIRPVSLEWLFANAFCPHRKRLLFRLFLSNPNIWIGHL